MLHPLFVYLLLIPDDLPSDTSLSVAENSLDWAFPKLTVAFTFMLSPRSFERRDMSTPRCLAMRATSSPWRFRPPASRSPARSLERSASLPRRLEKSTEEVLSFSVLLLAPPPLP